MKMNTKHTPGTRIIRAAAMLDTLYLNPMVVALNRSQKAKRDCIKRFWHDVSRALNRPYSCQSWLTCEAETWRLIRDQQARAALRQSEV